MGDGRESDGTNVNGCVGGAGFMWCYGAVVVVVVVACVRGWWGGVRLIS